MKMSDLPGATAEASFLQDLFDRLNQSGIGYCVLRNYVLLPHSLGESDLDILVDEAQGQSFRILLAETLRKHGGRCIGSLGQPVVKMCVCGHEDEWWGAELDIFVGDLKFRRYTFMHSQFVLQRTEHHNGVRVANPQDAAIIILLKEYLHNLVCRLISVEQAVAAYRPNRTLYRSELQRLFGPTVGGLWDTFLMGSDAVTGKSVTQATITHLRKTAGVAARLREKAQQISKYYRRLTARPGYWVAVLGTDGSGKSTIIDRVAAVLGRSLHHHVFHQHMRPSLLPSLARLFGRSVPEGPATAPHATTPSGLWGSLMRLNYYSMDYILGYWCKVFPALVRRPSVFLFDRYFYDYLIDPWRARIRLPRWLIRFYGFFIPTPDVILCLGTDPEVIHLRRPELPLREVERQVGELKKFYDRNKRAVWIDTGGSIDQSVAEVLEVITTKMAARCGGEYGS